jgi:hypothetical protein
MSSQILAKLELSNFNFEADIQRLNALPLQAEAYEEFGQGHWKNLALYNASGSAHDDQYRNVASCVPTSLIEQCPEINRFLVSNFQFTNLRMVRARNLIDGMVIPHRDFVELDDSHTYLHVFVPLEHNNDSYHSDASGVFQMQLGEVWFLDAAIDHAAINFSNHSRMFLCLDFSYKENFENQDIFSRSASFSMQKEPTYVARKALTYSHRQALVSGLSSLLSKHTFKDLVFAISKLHFLYKVEVAECYEWLVEAATINGEDALVIQAKALRRFLTIDRNLGERFSLNILTEQI